MNKTDWEMALSVLDNLEKEQNTPHILCGISFAKAAVEKQIPYKCGSIVGKCKCGKAVYPHMKNCSACGQRLNWSDTE